MSANILKFAYLNPTCTYHIIFHSSHYVCKNLLPKTNASLLTNLWIKVYERNYAFRNLAHYHPLLWANLLFFRRTLLRRCGINLSYRQTCQRDTFFVQFVGFVCEFANFLSRALKYIILSETENLD